MTDNKMTKFRDVEIRAARGNKLTAKSWLTEAPLRSPAGINPLATKAITFPVSHRAPLCYRTPQRGAKPRSSNNATPLQKIPSKIFIYAATLDPGALQPFQNFS